VPPGIIDGPARTGLRVAADRGSVGATSHIRGQSRGPWCGHAKAMRFGFAHRRRDSSWLGCAGAG